MIKLNDVILLYVPEDLVGNKILDPIRNTQSLDTKLTPQSAIQKFQLNITNDVKFVLVEEADGKKRYAFKLTLDQLLLFNLKQGALNPDLLLSQIDETLLQPIANQDGFFDTSFIRGELLDRSFLLPSDASEAEIAASKPDPAGAVYNNFKVQSKFVKFVKNDPFFRFSGNDTPNNAPVLPSFYAFVECGLNSPEFKAQSGTSLNYGIVDGTKNDHIAFYDYETYTAFLAGCEDIDSGRLRALSEYQTKKGPIEKQIVTQLQDYLPFYITTEFSVEREQKDGFSFASFLTNPDISPFFEQFVSFYVDFAKNPEKYDDKPWVDMSERYNIYTYKKADSNSPASAEMVGQFQTKIIDGAELVKDDIFFSNLTFDNGQTAPCSAIKRKISSILFRKKIKELLASVLDNDTKFWLNPNYSETICYRVTRTDKFTNKKTHWFVPNFPQLSDIKLFDSNGRYDRGQDIKYEVFALKATISVNYEYVLTDKQQKKLDQVLEGEVKPIFDENGKLTNLDELKNAPQSQFSTTEGTLKFFDYVSTNATLTELNDYFSNFADNKKLDPINMAFDVIATPAVNFLEVPYLIKEKNDSVGDAGVVIYDAPPAAPLLNLYPYRGVDNKITAVFSGYVDQYVAKKESILLGEDNINDKTELYSRQYYKFAKDELYYKTEMEDIDIFELMVLQKAPTKIEDFQDAEVVRIKNTFDQAEISLLRKNDLPFGSHYTLDLQPNKDYWLTSRVIDFNGNISNASPVYKVNIINDDGYINPTIGVFDMTKKRLPKEITTTPEFKRLLYIAPAPQHAAPYRSNKTIDAGLDTTAPYDKRYKIRLTSKTTNKKLELNVFFEKDIKEIETKDDLPAGYNYEQVSFTVDKEDVISQFNFEFGELGDAAGNNSDAQAAKDS